MKLLCVAEKPSIAKSISEILAGNGGFTSRPGKDKFCRNFDLQYNWASVGWIDVTVTSVRGHLTENDFGQRYKTWASCDPVVLFEAPVETKLSKDGEAIAANLRQEARRATMLMIWTDCDREGEHIGAEVVRECRKVNARIQVRRARFSAIIATQIHAACRGAGELDWAAASAVEARQELDLRVGAALTRLQTMNIQNALPELGQRVISYGPCQFPTLGFVVDQYEKVRNFVSEPFWYISVTLKRRGEVDLPLQTVTFTWRRGHLFDKATVEMLYRDCMASMNALVTKVSSKPTRKFKPYPLTTVELQKSGSRLLRMAPKRILDLAEALYNKGFLSYPRTETDQYDAQFDFKALIRRQMSDGEWGGHAQQLIEGDGYECPRNGKKNDKAHPPIHPTAHANNLSADEKRVYEYVTRRFLASCSKDARGKQTNIEIEMAEELFAASGLVISERNYLDVFPYDKWGDSLLPPFQEGERFKPSSCTLKEGSTSAPNLLTEADLVNLMDKNGIGTDATIAEHISKVIAREYVEARPMGKTTYLMPSTLGMGLVDGYNGIDFEKSLCKPLLRRETEFRMNLICEGQRTKEQTLEESIAEYRAMYVQTKRNLTLLIDSVRRYVKGQDGSTVSSAARRPERHNNRRGNDNDVSDDNGDDDYGDGGDNDDGGAWSAPTRAGSSRNTVAHRRSAGSVTAAQVPSRNATRSIAPLQRTLSDNTFNVGHSLPVAPQDISQPPQCRCGQSAVRRTVLKEGPSKGKQFWSCEKGQSEGSCGFFDWAIGEQGAVAGPSRTTAPQNRRSWAAPVSVASCHNINSRVQENTLTTSAARGNGSRINDFTAGSFAPIPEPFRSVSPEVMQTTTRERDRPRNNGSATLSRHFIPQGQSRISAGQPIPRQNQAQGPTREEIEARNEDIAVLDELAMSSQGGEESFLEDSTERIDEYRAWFADLATEAGAGGGGAVHAGDGRTGPDVARNKRCDCGLEAALKTVFKEGPTKGRKFYCCPKENASVRCRMFQWEEEGVDEDADANGGGGGGWTVDRVRDRVRGAGAGPGSIPGPGGTAGSCYKCGNEGHWAKDCPGESAVLGSRGRARTAGAGRGRGAAVSTSRGGGGGGQCFKCGEEGHWSSECPNDGPLTNDRGANNRGTSTSSHSAPYSTRGRGRGRGAASGVKRRAGGSGGSTTRKKRM